MGINERFHLPSMSIRSRTELCRIVYCRQLDYRPQKSGVRHSPGLGIVQNIFSSPARLLYVSPLLRLLSARSQARNALHCRHVASRTGETSLIGHQVPLVKIVGKTWERTQNLKMPAKSHRINGPYVRLRAHNPLSGIGNSNPASAKWASAQQCAGRSLVKVGGT